MSNPIAVVISDIHFNLNTLTIASEALKDALNEAYEFGVPLIIAGDLHDTKSVIRAEVANKLIEILKDSLSPVIILRGNHDQLHEKSEEHGLNYLTPYAKVIDKPCLYYPKMLPNHILFIPYQSDSTVIPKLIAEHADGNTKILIMHQGFKGAFMGDYIQDKSSIEPDVVKNYTVISGHYHKHQTIGTVTYVGNPYTLSFGEANDGPKGYLILNDDGTFIRNILHFRAHRILELNVTQDSIITENLPQYPEDTLLWVKVSGPEMALQRINKKQLGERLLGHGNYKLDLIPTDNATINQEIKNLSNEDLVDKIIDSMPGADHNYLKQLWREIL